MVDRQRRKNIPRKQKRGVKPFIKCLDSKLGTFSAEVGNSVTWQYCSASAGGYIFQEKRNFAGQGKRKKQQGLERLGRVGGGSFLVIASVGEHWFSVLPQMQRSGYAIVRT